MKKIFVIIVFIFCSGVLYSYQAEDIYLSNWKTYTNTTYIHQFFCKGDSIIAATWGGVSIFNKQDSTFSTLVKSDGLSKNELRSVHYIKEIDELWFGTYLEGISRYKDGKFLKPYQENQGVEGDFINDIDDNDEFVFVGTEKGLIMFEIIDNETQFKTTFKAPRLLSDNNVNCITFDDANRIWVGTNQGIDYAIINYDSMLVVPSWWHHINDDTAGYPFTEEKITCIDYFDNKIYFGTEDGFAIISEIDSDSLEFQAVTQNLPTRKISSILATDSTIWVAFGKWNETNQKYDDAKGVGRYNCLNSEWKFWDEDDSLFNQISDIQVDNNSNVWISAWQEGLYCINSNDVWEQYKQHNCINSNVITVMMIDSNQNLWCAFGEMYSPPKGVKGLSKFDGKKWTNFRKSPLGIGNDNVYSMCEDLNGNKWFGHWGGSYNISVLDSGETEWIQYKMSETDWIISTSISILECDEYNNIWIGEYAATPGGVIILEPDWNYRQFTLPILADNNTQADMWAMLLTEDRVWFGCRYNGIQYWNGPGFPQNPPSDYWHQFAGSKGISCFDFDIQTTDYGDYIFAGCDDGLYMYDEYWDEWYKYANGLIESVKQYFWNGIEWQNWIYYWYDEQGNPEPRLGSGKISQVNAIFVDPHGRKWIATNGGGISVLDVDNYYFTNFTTENSDLCSDVVLSFAYNSYSGELFVGTTEGLCSFNIGASKKDESLSKIVKRVSVFPNPFISSEHNNIYFEAYPDKKLPHGKNLLYIYNLAGELVTILNESDQYRFCWDGKNKANKDIASGIYFYVLSSEFDDVHITGKFAVIR